MMSVINEVRSYDLTYSKVMENEKKILSNSQLFRGCIDGKLLEYMRNDHFTLFREIVEEQKRGAHRGIRLITSIDTSIVRLVEEFLTIGVEIRHVSDIGSRLFVVSAVAVLEIPKSGDLDQDQRLQIDYDSKLVHIHLYAFENLWQSATSGRDRISELKTKSAS
jgi:hypothetical protein